MRLVKGAAYSSRAIFLLPSALLLAGCQSASTPPDLASPDPTLDQQKISAYHAQQAAFFRMKAKDLTQQVLVYEGLFGPDSDWVSGARLLARFYDEAAQEQDRLVQTHRTVADQERPLP